MGRRKSQARERVLGGLRKRMEQVAALSREGRVATLRRDLNRGIRDERQQASPISKRLLQAEEQHVQRPRGGSSTGICYD